MNASKTFLEMLKRYDVTHVFGLPGETTLPLYKEWLGYPEINHILARDERSTAFMADVYSRFSFKPGLCEAPSVGSTHLMPGLAEAYKASVPVIAITSDIPLYYETRNMLTGIDQTALFTGITKESLTIYDPNEIPNIIRRAFRQATGGRLGPVHIRFPHDIQNKETTDPILDVQKDFTKYPAQRPTADESKILEAVNLLTSSNSPVIVCGQGVLYSQAWDAVRKLAELYGIPIGTTINAKGVIADSHPLSLGVIGARGGTSISNNIICESDLVFFIGSSTDSAGTDNWSCPPIRNGQKIIQLDICESEVGNNYPTNVALIGDARSTIKKITELTVTKAKNIKNIPRIQEIRKKTKKYQEYVKELTESVSKPVHPLRFIKELQNSCPEDFCMVLDVGTSAIYTSTYFQVKNPGRRFVYNFAMGSLGFAIPGSIGARIAKPNSCVIGLVGDGSFGLTVGELETINRLGGNINLILINNRSYGWIKAEWALSFGSEYVDFATNFNDVNYMKVAEGFGLTGYQITKPSELTMLKEAFSNPNPSFIEIIMKPENELVPPVPKWIKKAKEKGFEYLK
jgi:acetolactate synthase-1/2/3 large subunit